MKYLHLLIITLSISTIALSQDNFHNQIENILQNDYNLSSGEWLFYDNEVSIYNEASAYGDIEEDVVDISGQIFSKNLRIDVLSTGENPWDSAWGIGNKSRVNQGDKVLIVFYIRSKGQSGKVSFFVENEDYAKEVFYTIPVDEEWRRYFIRFEASETYDINTMNVGFHLAFQEQNIEIGGFTGINYQNNFDLEEIPNEINNQFYGGWEEDAPWRVKAEERINKLRKTDLSISCNNSKGVPVRDVIINVKMIQHEFAFGTAINASNTIGTNNNDARYRERILNLDGKGHGFNWVVFENDFKWDGWESEWFVDKEELSEAVQWYRKNNIKIRGHNLLWPGIPTMPDDIGQNINNLNYVKDRIFGHQEDILTHPLFKNQFEEWDALNEITTNQDIEFAFQNSPDYTTGREFYIELFNKIRSLDANVGLWLNDFVSLSSNNAPGTEQYEELKLYTREIVEANVDLEGIGFQAHIGGFPNGIPSVLETYDDFYSSFGLKAKVTEFDLPTSIDDEVAAKYLVDFMTASFSHPSMDGFMFWSFWDGATYMNEGSNLFNLNWEQTKVGEAYVDLVFDKWWTNAELITGTKGESTVDVFKGLYEISYTCNEQIVKDTLNVLAPLSKHLVCDHFLTGITDVKENTQPNIFPNPTSDFIHIARNSNVDADVSISDITGREIWKGHTNTKELKIPVHNLEGIYFVIIIEGSEQFVKKIIVNR